MRIQYSRLRTVQMPGKVALVCAQCGTPFWMWPSDIKGNASKFCSKACCSAAKRRPERICVECGASFLPWNRGPQQLCSMRCRNTFIPKRTLGHFWTRVTKTGECWLWTGRTHNGYGMVANRRAHRVAWELTHGPIPDGLDVLHQCDNPPCVRPDHLRIGTHADNMREASERRRFPNGAAWRLAHAGANVKVTEDDVRAIRARYAAGDITQKDLGLEYGLSQSGISGILSRSKWSDVK